MEELHLISGLASWYMRRPNPERQQEGYRHYKKGWEVRLSVKSLDDLEMVRRLLVESGFETGRPFRKQSRWVQPLYGRDAVERFLSLVQQRFHKEIGTENVSG